jgi:hypothetical protein
MGFRCEEEAANCQTNKINLPFFCVGGGFGPPHIDGRYPGEEAEEVGDTLPKDHKYEY